METLLKQKVDLMVENYHVLKGSFRLESNLLKHLAALSNASKGKMVNIDTIKEVKKYIKDETGFTSYFRGTNAFILANLLSLEDDYKELFKSMLVVFDKLRKEKFKNSQYLPLACYTIAKEVDRGNFDYAINRMKQFYQRMKENHFWLTSPDDYVFAAVLAATDLDVSQTSIRIEECYNTLNKSGFYKGNDLQTLSHVLALGEEGVNEKCSKAYKIYRGLKDNKCKLQYSGLASIGVLTLISTDEEKTVNEVKEVYDYIYEKDGYGFWSLDKSMRTILASSLVADFYVDNIKKGILQITLSNSINAIIIAQQQAAIAAACAASAAAASSSTNS